ncbi:uncharacterized protein LOC9643899 [Selaginella moellendorffii]|uniref:uncharacterized protein LOC9643899 n=1 Tax=Selaginella moellendorffii TaxID=88036 RepID=UPI000D1C3084|nr:uncharacterized protein LOC9643899 [Selaginella moellendorffii]|eukprot:XP_024544979.1 uncharacterized protein LOC9643899 [Selaginella moellendorffii]
MEASWHELAALGGGGGHRHQQCQRPLIAATPIFFVPRCHVQRNLRIVCSVSESFSPSTATALQSKKALSNSVSIYDTTLRDGAQMVGISLTLNDKLKIAKALADIGVDYIEGGWPGSNPKDAEFFKLCKDNILKGQSSKLAAFGSTRRKNSTCEEDTNVQALLFSEAEVITVVAKAWDVQVTRVLETTLAENLRMVAETISYFKVRSKEVMLDAEHFFDGFTANRAYSLECLKIAAKAGVDVVVLCDTNGGSMPWTVEEVTRTVKEELMPWPHVRIGVHTHNDTELAVANSLAAVRGGASLVQGCVNGYGERTGNANLISVIGGLQVKMGFTCIPPESLANLSKLASTVADVTKQTMSPTQPYVGSAAFAHKGGIHVAAIRRMPESYNHMDPTVVGNAMRSVVSELSGKGNILDKAEKAGLVLDNDVAGSVLAHIKQMEREGCAFENAGASVDMLIVRKGKRYQQPFQVLEFTVLSSNRGVHSISSNGNSQIQQDNWLAWCGSDSQVNQAMVKLSVDGKSQVSAAEGIGPVDALSHALRSALEKHYPQLEQVELADYHVHLVEPSTAHKGTLSTTRVTVDFTDASGNKWTTVGAHTSIVEASFRALVDGLEFGIVNCSEDGCSAVHKK